MLAPLQVHESQPPGDILVFLTGEVATPATNRQPLACHAHTRFCRCPSARQALHLPHPQSARQPTTTTVNPKPKTLTLNPAGQEEIEALERMLTERAAQLEGPSAGASGTTGGAKGGLALQVLPIYASLPPEQQMRVSRCLAAA